MKRHPFPVLMFIAYWSVVSGFAQANSSVGQWSMGPLWDIVPINLQVLPTGKVMFYPGNTPAGGDDSRLWDPVTGTHTYLPKANYDLFCSGNSFLQDGTMLVSGGNLDFDSGIGLATVSVYNPSSDVWTRGPDMNAGRWYPSTTTMGNGEVLVMTGYIDSIQFENPLPQVWQPASGTWRDLTNANLKIPNYSWVFLHYSSQALVVGPGRDTRLLNTAGTGSWSYLTSFNYPDIRDYGSAVMYDPSAVLIAGGGLPPTNTAEVLDLSATNPTWRYTGSMAFARRQMNLTLLPDDNVLATGGTSDNELNPNPQPVLAAEMWNPTTGVWTTMASQQFRRFYHSAAILLPDGRVLSTGGDGVYQTEIYSPPYLFKGARPTITAAPTHVNYGQTFFVGTNDAANIEKVRLIRLPAVTHAFDQNQRMVRLNYTITANGLNVTAPSDPNRAPPGHYMLFILNSNGAPSVAKIIQIDDVANTPATMNVTPSVVSAGETVTVSWASISPSTLTDWIGRYVPGADHSAFDTSSTGWLYAKDSPNCTQTTPTGTAAPSSGSCTFTMPSAGTYQFRFFGNGHTDDWRVTSNNVTVNSNTPATMNVTPSVVSAGETVTVSWASISPSTLTDWIGRYVPGADHSAFDTSSTGWLYAKDSPNCTQTTPTGTAAPSSGSCTFTMPSAGTYQFRFFGNDHTDDWRVTSNDVTVNAPLTIPATPTNLVATGVSRTRINLTWADNANNESGFKIERKTGTANFSEIATVGPNVTSYANTGLSRNTTYTYRVRAYNSAGNSTYSNSADATTLR